MTAVEDRRTAEELRRANAALDARLRQLTAAVPVDRLHTDPGNGEWTLAENLAHIAEFPRYFVADLTVQLQEEGPIVGRTHKHPDRLAAIAAARGRTLESLQEEVDAALRDLAARLEQLRDEDLDRLAHNRKYGPEPLRAFLDRYVLHHKAAHVLQLETTIRAVGGEVPRDA